MAGTTILLVEDEVAIQEMVRSSLEHVGFCVDLAGSAAEAEAQLGRELPRLILLDWMLPGVSGVEFARRLRREDKTKNIPIIMLTARTEENDRVLGFDAGADDYVCKPFSVRELVARIKAVLRRSTPIGDDQPLRIDGLLLDPVSHRVTADGEPLKMGPTEFRMLHFFMGHQERVFTRGQLLDRVWGSNVYVEERTVDVHIRRLRKVLGTSGYDRLVQTVHGTGYRFSTRPDA